MCKHVIHCPVRLYGAFGFAEYCNARWECVLKEQEHVREQRGDCEQDLINDHSIRCLGLMVQLDAAILVCYDTYPVIYASHYALECYFSVCWYVCNLFLWEVTAILQSYIKSGFFHCYSFFEITERYFLRCDY